MDINILKRKIRFSERAYTHSNSDRNNWIMEYSQLQFAEIWQVDYY